MQLNLSRAVAVVLVMTLAAGCATVTPTPAPAPTSIVEQPTQTPYPTSSPYPTYTPYPTATPLPTNTPMPTATATETASPTPTPTQTRPPVAIRPAAPQPAAGSAELWRTPGAYKPVAPNLCATYVSSIQDRDWQETFCIIRVEVNPSFLRFYGDWKIKLIRGSFKSLIYHPNSRAVTFAMDNLGNKYIYGKLGGAADEDRFIQSPDYLMGYKDNQDAGFPHEPDSFWEFQPAKPGASSFNFVNDKYGFKIGPITLSK